MTEHGEQEPPFYGAWTYPEFGHPGEPAEMSFTEYLARHPAEAERVRRLLDEGGFGAQFLAHILRGEIADAERTKERRARDAAD